MKSVLRIASLCVTLLVAACTPGVLPEAQGPDGTVFHPMMVERLPALNAPRGGHHTLLLNDELTLIGGHTDGFKLLETAEYLKGGTWHEVPLHYPHDGGFAAPLPDGTVMAGGGSAEPFGVGQTLGVEIYDPATHSSNAIGILDRKRAYASALSLPDGGVVISGNWYAEDGISRYDSSGGFSCVREVSVGRQRPFILPAGPDEVIVFTGRGNYSTESLTGGLVDRLHGDSYCEPVLQEWIPNAGFLFSDTDGKIGEYTYLLAALRADGTPGVLKVSGGIFSVVELEKPFPGQGIDGGEIRWWSKLQADRSRRQAWLKGDCADGRIYFARIDYDATFEGGKASVTIFYAGHPDGRHFPIEEALLLPGGRLAMAGGKGLDPKYPGFPAEDNFATSREAFVFHSEPQPAGAVPWWAWMTGVLLLGGLTCAVILAARRRRAPEPVGKAGPAPGPNPSLAEQISLLIGEEELYKRKDLRIDDVASALATNRTYVSTILNNISGISFSDLVNGHRVRHAQTLIREHPEMLLADVADASGFSSITTFRRNFKAVTGMNPAEWKAKDSNTGKK
ncbi:MAG: helix-turn-helix domain-containing protein [Bacteroidales bacterium]|nr:helix-turn-helix domain-containing protein [Bacteroidales bacterium]